MAVYAAIPTAVLDGAVIFVGEDTYRAFTMQLVEKNYHFYDGAYANGECFVPGTNVKVIAVAGLNGTGSVIAGRPENFFYGCDMVNDQEKFDFWYSRIIASSVLQSSSTLVFRLLILQRLLQLSN